MKKIFAAAVAALVCISVDAQLWVGGSLAVKSINDEDASDIRETQLDFEPTVGYALSDNFEIGATLELSTISNYMNTEDGKYTGFGISPFARYKFFESGKLSFHIQGGVSYFSSKTKYPASRIEVLEGNFELIPAQTIKSQEFKVGVEPLVKYSITDHIALVSSFGWLGFNSTKDDYSMLKLNLDSELSFGIYYAF